MVREGRVLFERFARQHRSHLPWKRTGALLCAWTADEANRLPVIAAKAARLGLATKLLTREEVLKREPRLSQAVVAGLAVPDEAVGNAWAIAMAYLNEAVANGADVVRSFEVTVARRGGGASGGWVLEDAGGRRLLHAALVVNAAGNAADLIDRLAFGADSVAYAAAPRKGQFVVYGCQPVKSLILPIPTAETKGVLVNVNVHGTVSIGPTAEDQASRDDRSNTSEARAMLTAAGHRIIPDLAVSNRRGAAARGLVFKGRNWA